MWCVITEQLWEVLVIGGKSIGATIDSSTPIELARASVVRSATAHTPKEEAATAEKTPHGPAFHYALG